MFYHHISYICAPTFWIGKNMCFIYPYVVAVEVAAVEVAAVVVIVVVAAAGGKGEKAGEGLGGKRGGEGGGAADLPFIQIFLLKFCEIQITWLQIQGFLAMILIEISI